MWFHLYEILECAIESLASESKISRRGSGKEGQEGGCAKRQEETFGGGFMGSGGAWKETEGSTRKKHAGDRTEPRQRAA